MLTLALATIVVLVVASLALMLWPEVPPPAPFDSGEPDAADRGAREEDGEPDTPSA